MRCHGRRTPVLGALAVLAALPVFPAGAPAARNDIVYSTEVVTPHVPWAARLPGGPIRGFFIPSISRGRDMVELMQRLSLAPTTVSIDRQWDVNCWGLGDFYGHETRGDCDDFRIVYGYVEEDLTGPAPFDVLVLPGLNGWSRLTRPTRDAVLRRVREGAGLVLLHPFVGDVAGHPFRGDEPFGDDRIWDLSPLVGVADDPITERGYPVPNPEAIVQGRWEKAGEHFITDGVDFALLARGGQEFYRYQARGDVLIQAGGLPVVRPRRPLPSRVRGQPAAGGRPRGVRADYSLERPGRPLPRERHRRAHGRDRPGRVAAGALEASVLVGPDVEDFVHGARNAREVLQVLADHVVRGQHGGLSVVPSSMACENERLAAYNLFPPGRSRGRR